MSRILIYLISIFFFSCDSNEQVYQAQGEFINSNNIKIGTVEIVQQGSGSNFRIHLDTLLPGYYAMHIHEIGKCESPEFLSAGDHHGLKPNGSLSGDFKPIHVKNEVSKYTGKLKKFSQIIFLKDIYLNPDLESTIIDKNGSAIIIHENENGGKRIACANIVEKS